VEDVLMSAPVTAADDDRDRLGRFFDARHAVLIRFALRVSHDRDEAFDLVQEAFVRALNDIRRVPADDEPATAWMYRVITNLARDRYRRRRVREFAAALLGRRRQTADPADAIVGTQSVRTALATLPPRQRAVIALCELEGLTTKETAAALAIRETTVRWHLKQAKERLVALLGDQR
jgi:RNA polymerase sigma-70 factor (ECF subfamily)